MYSYGSKSEAKFITCDPDIVRVFRKGLQLSPFDITIIWGGRTDDQQEQAFMSGNSKKRTGSKHQAKRKDTGKMFSQAIDFGPWCLLPDGTMGIPWNDTHAFAVIGGIIIAAAKVENVPVVYGGDWDMDGLTTDQTLMDWGHVQLVTPSREIIY